MDTVLQPPAPVVASMDLANKDVLTEILLRLPAKSLIRFKLVCKKWLSLISSDLFCHRHTLRRPKLQQSLILQMHTSQFFYFNQTINSGKVMIPYTPSVPNHKILQDCNGLLLLEFERDKNSYYVYNPTTKELKLNPKNSYYVYNPTTRKSRKVILTQSDKFPYVEAINLAFDPSKSPYYKLVCVRSTSYEIPLSCAKYKIEVYDSESHTWDLSLKPYTCPRICNDGVHWNNSIFWSIRGHGVGRGDGYCCFDIAKNVIRNIPFPRCPYAGLYTGISYLEESSGNLYRFQLLKGHQGVSVAVWELGGCDDSWLSKHRDAGFQHDISPVRFMGGLGLDGATCSLLTYEHEVGRMMAYNFRDESYELLVDFTGQPVPRFDRVMKGFLFGEILALV